MSGNPSWSYPHHEVLRTTVSMARQTPSAFALGRTVLSIYETPGGGTRLVPDVSGVPTGAQPIIRDILLYLGGKIASYHGWGSHASLHWERDRDSGLLRYPERHVAQSGDVVYGIIAVLPHTRCTVFVLLQHSNMGTSINTYFSTAVDPDTRPLTGTTYERTFADYEAYRTKMLELVDGFRSRDRNLNPMWKILLPVIERGAEDTNTVRVGRS